MEELQNNEVQKINRNNIYSLLLDYSLAERDNSDLHDKLVAEAENKILKFIEQVEKEAKIKACDELFEFIGKSHIDYTSPPSKDYVDGSNDRNETIRFEIELYKKGLISNLRMEKAIWKH